MGFHLTDNLDPAASEREKRLGNEPVICVKTLADTGGKRWTCYHFCYHPSRFIYVSASLRVTWRRGESNPCFLRIRPLRSGKGFIREDLERISLRGNAWMDLDVIGFVIRWRAPGKIRNRSIGQLVSTMKMAVSGRI